MNIKNIRSGAAAVATGLLLIGAMPMVAMAAVPNINSVSPSFAIAGSGALTMTVSGSNFDSNALVYFNGSAKATTYVSSTTLNALIPASDLTTLGTYSVTVNNPSAGGGTSNAVSFTVGNLSPPTSVITPSAVATGSAGFAMTVYGSNFIPSSVVNFGGLARSTAYVSSTQLTATINASDIAGAGAFNVTVSNPTPGGGTSNAQVFTVTGNNAVPTLSSISPSSTTAGSGSFIMTLYGSNFTPGSYVRFNGLVRATAFVSSSQLTAVILASDVAMTGSHLVDVVNPASGGGISTSLLFTINPISTTPGLPNTGFGPTVQGSAGIAGMVAVVA